MTMLSILLLLASPPPTVSPLDEAVQCYWELDYTCTEARLVEALATKLSREDRVRARLFEALVAMAFRDERRARQAVRELLAIDSSYDPGDVPPRLRTIFVEERPPPPRGFAWAHYGRSLTLDNQNDARYWAAGDGLSMGGGIRFPSNWSIEIDLRYSRFYPLESRPFEDFELWSGTLGVSRVWRVGPVHLGQGLGLGFGHGDMDTVMPYVDVNPFILGAFTAYTDVIWPVWKKWAVNLRVSPMMLIRTRDEQPVVSYLLPLMAGVRYGR
jgi:hypothetical protein